MGALPVLPGEASVPPPVPVSSKIRGGTVPGTGVKTDSWAVAKKADMIRPASSFLL